MKTRNVIFLLSGLVLLMLMVEGCSRKVTSATETHEVSVDDSTHIEYVPQYVEIKLPGDTVTVVQRIECDSLTNKPKPFMIKAKSTRMMLRVDLDSKGDLITTCAEDSLKQIVKTMDKTIFHLRHEVDVSKKIVPQYLTRKIDIICRWIAGIVVGLTVGYGIYRLTKLYVKLKPF
jgi:hypothetical protein